MIFKDKDGLERVTEAEDEEPVSIQFKHSKKISMTFLSFWNYRKYHLST